MRLVIAFSLLLGSSLALALSETGQAINFTLKSADGSNVRLSELRGEVVLINFWASWCGPCRQEMPELDELQSQYRDLGFTVLGINVEQNREAAERVLKDIPVEFSVLFDEDNRVSEEYGVDAMPATLLVDRSGVIRFAHRGYKPGYEKLYEQQIRELLRE